MVRTKTGSRRVDRGRSHSRRPISTHGRRSHRPTDSRGRFYSLVGLLVALPIAALGGLYLWPPQGEHQGAVCVLVVDRTGSSVYEETQSSYQALAKKTVEGCRRARASLAIYYFDNANAKLQQASEDQPFQLFRPPKHRKRLGEEQVKKEMRRAGEAVSAVFRTPASSVHATHGSDIVTAVGQAAQALQQAAKQASVQRKFLIVLTDGYQTGGELGLRRNLPNPEASPAKVVGKARELGLIPVLNGVQTSFVGVGGGVAAASTNKPEWFEASVRAFWSQLVQEGGGSMCVYSLEPLSLPGEC